MVQAAPFQPYAVPWLARGSPEITQTSAGVAARIRLTARPFGLGSPASTKAPPSRRSTTDKLSLDLGDWLLAMTATCAGLLVVPGMALVPALIPLGVFFAIVGNGIQAWAKLVLRRSFGVAPANRGVKISGPYRFVRHPMYAGYAMVHLTVMILMFHPINIVIYAIGWWAQILRLLAEERLLGQDPAYAEYMQTVRWRLIPGLF